MSHNALRAGAFAIFAAVCLAGLHEQQTLGQGLPGAPAAQGPGAQGPAGGGRGGRGGRGGQPPGPPPTAQAGATVDLTGYWVSLVTEDWRWRMKVPDKGDVSSIPFTADQTKRAVLQAWDPAKDEAEGNQCKSYGAAAIMRVPTRVHITWESENVLKLETDAGTQTRLFRFGAAAQTPPGERTWQGSSVGEWEPAPAGRGGRGGGFPGGPGGPPGGLPGGPGPGGPGGAVAAPTDDDVAPAPAVGRGAPAGPAVRGDLKVVTTNLKPGYLRKNGVPYSEKTTVTEYFNRTSETYGTTYMVVTTIVEDPEYLTQPFITSSHFKKLPDANNGWDPTPCSTR
jgi:hypothetical protein